MRIGIDSNLLIYSAGLIKVPEDAAKTRAVRSLLEWLPTRADIVCPLQTLGEVYRVLRRNGWISDRCRNSVLQWRDRFEVVPSSASAFWSALDTAEHHRLQIWDALILSVAAEANCTIFLSEDLQAGFTLRGMTVVNPLTLPLDQRLARLHPTLQ